MLEIDKKKFLNLNFESFYENLSNNKILLIKDIDSLDIFTQFFRSIGQTRTHPASAFGHNDYKDVLMIGNVNSGNNKSLETAVGTYHIDYAYLEKPDIATALLAIKPDKQATTIYKCLNEFATKVIAYLNQINVKHSDLKVVHDYRYFYENYAKDRDISSINFNKIPPVKKNLFYFHPITGEIKINFSRETCREILLNDKPNVELKNVIDGLLDESNIIHEHKYDENSILVWDNLSVTHSPGKKAIGERQLARITLINNFIF